MQARPHEPTLRGQNETFDASPQLRSCKGQRALALLLRPSRMPVGVAAACFWMWTFKRKRRSNPLVYPFLYPLALISYFVYKVRE